jgi:hypothetical protein
MCLEGIITGLHVIKLDHAFSFAKCSLKVAAPILLFKLVNTTTTTTKPFSPKQVGVG